MVRLTVRPLDGDEIRRDLVRIPRRHRQGLKENQICRLKTANAEKLLLVLGDGRNDDAHIYMDQATRKHFGINEDDRVNFTISKGTRLDEYRWLLRHSDIALRTANRLGLLSVVLGVMSLLLGILALYLTIWPRKN